MTAKRVAHRVAAVTAATSLLLGIFVAFPAAAGAARIGGLIVLVNPADADFSTFFQLKLRTTSACPTASTTTAAYLSGGPQAWPDATATSGRVAVSDPGPDVTPTTAFRTTRTLAEAASAAGRTLEPGTYLLSLVCFADAAATVPTGSWDATITMATVTFGGVTELRWTASPPAPVGVSSTTTVQAPAAATVGSTMTISATVTAPTLPEGVTASGSVIFDLPVSGYGPPIRLTGLTNAVGGVTVSTATTADGRFASGRSLAARFEPDDYSVVQESTSTPVTISLQTTSVTLAPTLTISPASPTSRDSLVLVATADVAQLFGTPEKVILRLGNTVVGMAPADSAGTAQFTLPAMAAGDYSFTISYFPVDSAPYEGFGTTTLYVTVSAVGATVPIFALENIVATVPTGTLTLTAATTPVDLGTLTLDPSNTHLVPAVPAALSPVTVTDTRPGQFGYTVSGMAADLTSAGHLINAENLGWTPVLVGPVPPSVQAAAGPAIAPGEGVAPGASVGAGLKTARALATATYDPVTGRGSVGTIRVSAALTLHAPTTTPAGTYLTTLVITAI